MKIPGICDIQQAHKTIAPWVHRTPVLKSRLINEITGAEVLFKCENFQRAGAFKFRGASNAVNNLTQAELARGVATHSSGNHGAALALAAAKKGIPAYIVMNETAPLPKKNAVKDYGGRITFCPPRQEARKAYLEKVVEETGATFVHPYNNFSVICGQGTTGIELLEAVNTLDIVMTPVGGGGLLSGVSTAIKSLAPEVQVIAAEPWLARDAKLSFETGQLHKAFEPKTIADGLLTSLSELTFTIIRQNVDQILTVSEEHIIQAMRYIWERMKIITEPSAAVPLGAILEHPGVFRNKRVGIVISGGNVALDQLPF